VRVVAGVGVGDGFGARVRVGSGGFAGSMDGRGRAWRGEIGAVGGV
jgi:hypothetical protein